MNLFFHFLIFIIILFLYLHIVHQLKTSEDLEIYELDYKDYDYLQEVCDLKQPATFSYESIHPEFVEKINMDFLEEKSKHDIKIKETHDYYKEDQNHVDYFILPLDSYQSLIKTDTHQNYISENNHFFIEESGCFDIYQMNDIFLEPRFSINKQYDLLSGSENSCTPFKYHNDLRYFIVAHSGKIKIKMTPWKSSKYLYPIKDYQNYEFYSPIHIWKPQRKYFQEMDKMHFLEFELEKGQALYIPPYWWYSFQYTTNDTLISSFTYNSLVNHTANAKELFLYFLQQSNTKTKITKTFDISKINKIDENDNKDDDIEHQIQTSIESNL